MLNTTKDTRYTLEELQIHLDAQSEPVEASHTRQQEIIKELAKASTLDLNPNADISQTKFELLCDTEPKFKRTWDRKRKDIKDQTASGYDLALAHYAVHAGWTDQETVNLLIAWRRKHNEDLKLRHDYYAATIAKARSGVDIKAARDEGREDDNHKNPLQSLRAALRGSVRGKEQELPIKRVIKRGVIRSDYDLELDDGTLITLGSSSNVLTPSKVQAAIMDGYGMVIRDYTKAKWRLIAQYICDAAVIVETSSEEIETRSWLEDFESRCLGAIDIDDTDQLREVLHDGANLSGFKDKKRRIYIRLNELVRFVTLHYGARTTERDTANRLSRIGFESRQLSVRTGERIDKLRLWRSPENFIEAEEEDIHRGKGVPNVPYIH